MRLRGWRRGAVLFLLGALSGCASYAWDKEGVTRQQYERDKDLCERHAEGTQRPASGTIFRPPGLPGSPGYYGPPSGGYDENLFIRCMEARGYERVKK